MDKAIKYLLLIYVVLAACTSFLLPPSELMSLDNYIFPLASIAVLYKYRSHKAFWISAVIIGFITFSSLLSNYVNGGITVSELVWSLRYGKLFVLGWSVVSVISESRGSYQTILVFGFLGMVIVNALQLIGINSVIELYATKPETITSMTYNLLDGRLFGTVHNPNNNGLIFALFTVYFLVSKVPWKYVYVVISALMIILTQSRTAFIALVLVAGVIVVLHLWKKSKRQFLLFLGGSCVAILLLFQLKLSNLSSLFNGEAFYSNSLTTRFEMVDNVLKANAERSFLGMGKTNNIPEVIGGSIDNEYIYIYLEYGILGSMAFLVVLALLISISFRNGFSSGNIGLLIIMLICGLTNLSFSNLLIGVPFVLLFIGLIPATAGVTNVTKGQEQNE